MSYSERPPTLEEYARAKRAQGDFPLKRKAIATKYSIEMPMDDFCALESYENELPTIDNCLFTTLEKQTYACDVDYNGHFGNYIYLTLETEDDTPEMWADIMRIITEQIQKAKEWQPSEE